MSGLSTEILRTTASLEALAPEWRRLWQQCETATPFQSPDWLLPWWQAFAPGALRTIAVRKDGRLVGLAPLYRESGAHGARLLPLGISLSDYCDILLEPLHASAAADAIAAALAEMGDIDAVSWNELSDGACASLLAAPDGWRAVPGSGSVCPVAALPKNGGSLKSKISSSRWRHLRTARNRAARRGEANIFSGDEENANLLLSELVRLHTAAWRQRGLPGVFCDERVAQFHRAALPRLMRQRLVRLYALRIGGIIAAVYYGFQHRRRAYAYLSGYDPDFAFESPAAILIAHAMEQAICEGAQQFDFLRGQEAYKYEWGAADRSNAQLQLIRERRDRLYA